jgi:hypothetical protein
MPLQPRRTCTRRRAAALCPTCTRQPPGPRQPACTLHRGGVRTLSLQQKRLPASCSTPASCNARARVHATISSVCWCNPSPSPTAPPAAYAAQQGQTGTSSPAAGQRLPHTACRHALAWAGACLPARPVDALAMQSCRHAAHCTPYACIRWRPRKPGAAAPPRCLALGSGPCPPRGRWSGPM